MVDQQPVAKPCRTDFGEFGCYTIKRLCSLLSCLMCAGLFIAVAVSSSASTAPQSGVAVLSAAMEIVWYSPLTAAANATGERTVN